ncbi:MAG: hypothetical protein M1834_003644 [Cirrosporium novae-zelandiae]|nr:MAG: hypothetical protein M1834_003644 [Cirrosporium novae-zelandiae]
MNPRLLIHRVKINEPQLPEADYKKEKLTAGFVLRLVRFLAQDGKTYYGDAILPAGMTDIAKATKANIIQGDIFGTHTVTNQVASITRLLSPLPPTKIQTVRCLGLNYAAHAHESKMPLPTYPVVFHKPKTAIAGPHDVIPIPSMAQEVLGLDYECELVIIIGKSGRDIPASSALEHVLGYSVGDDVSHREWQLKRGGGQWSLGKGFDGWAPMGPGIVSSNIIKDPQALKISTKLNGRVVQESSTADMIFGVKETIAFLSRGTTLLAGDVIFTGT